jgi:hypothetical protein
MSGRALNDVLAVGAKPLASNGVIIKGNSAVCEDLVGSAAFAGNKYDVTGAGVGQRGLDSDLSVGLNAHLAWATKAGQ